MVPSSQNIDSSNWNTNSDLMVKYLILQNSILGKPDIYNSNPYSSSDLPFLHKLAVFLVEE